MTNKNLFIDGRVTVSGNKSILKLENPINLTTYIQSLISTSGSGSITSLVYNPSNSELTLTTSTASFVTTITNSIQVENTLFVMEGGNDGTGARERLDLPFATPWAAIAAAQPGDTVMVYPHTYVWPNQVTTQRLVKNGVNMFCYPGVKINFTSTANTVGALSSPFSDDGAPMISGIYGEADITFLGSAASNVTPVLNHPTSELTIECKTFRNRTRLSSSSAKRITFRAEKHTGEDSSIFRVFNSFKQPTEVIYEVDEVTQGSAFYSTDYSPFQFDNFNSDGYININIKKLNYFTTFFLQGLFFFQRIDAMRNITVEDSVFTQEGNIPFIYANNFLGSNWQCSGHQNIKIHSRNHRGSMWRFTNPGIAPEYGTVEMTGVHNLPDTLWTATAALTGITNGSKIRILLDLLINDNALPNFPQYCDATLPVASTSKVFVEGKVRIISATGTQLFQIGQAVNNVSPIFKNFTLEADSTFFADSAHGAQIVVPCMGVFSNVGFDPVKHAAGIEPLTVSPLVNV